MQARGHRGQVLMSMPEYTPEVWQTYMNWAYSHAKEFGKNPIRAKCEDEKSRLPLEQDKALALILFSAFLLETRLRQYIKSVYPAAFPESYRPKHFTLDSMLPMVPLARGSSGKTPLDYGELWNHNAIEQLRHWRNWIAHGNINYLTEKMQEQDKKLPEIALGFFNAVMRGLAAIHKADGRTNDPDSLQLILDYKPLEGQ
jgi:hypothetical protein